MRILVPVDESLHSRRVIEFISHRETLLGTTPEIELVNVQYSVPETIIHLFGMEAVKQYYLEAGKKVFDELGPETLRRRGVTERVLYGDIGKTLAEEAEVFKADLIVMGTRGLNPVKGLLLGSVSNDLLARTKVPMLLLRDKTPPLTDKLRVGIFVDGSDYGAAAADFVLRNRELFGAKSEFTVVHASAPIPDPVAPNPVSPHMPTLTRQEREAEQCRVFADAVKPVIEPFEAAGLAVKAELVVGDADHALADYANKNLDIVVMGSHGYGNFKAAVLGSTAMHVAALTEAPVLVIRKD